MAEFDNFLQVQPQDDDIFLFARSNDDRNAKWQDIRNALEADNLTVTGTWTFEDVSIASTGGTAAHQTFDDSSRQTQGQGDLGMIHINSGDTFPIDIGSTSRVIFAVTDTGDVAIFAVDGTDGEVFELHDPDSQYTTSKGSSGSINIYWNSGVKVQDETFFSFTLRLFFLGEQV